MDHMSSSRCFSACPLSLCFHSSLLCPTLCSSSCWEPWARHATGPRSPGGHRPCLAGPGAAGASCLSSASSFPAGTIGSQRLSLQQHHPTTPLAFAEGQLFTAPRPQGAVLTPPLPPWPLRGQRFSLNCSLSAAEHGLVCLPCDLLSCGGHRGPGSPLLTAGPGFWLTSVFSCLPQG